MRVSEDRSGPLVTCTGNPGRSPVLTGELVPVDWHGLLVQVTNGPEPGGGGLAGLPVNRFVDISMCTPRGGSNLTPKVYLLMTAIITFYVLPLLSKIRPDSQIPCFC